jgi:IS30 family transposase
MLATNIDVYFCDPQSPWQRGSKENNNGLLRQYFSEGHRLVDALASLSEQSGSLAQRTTT